MPADPSVPTLPAETNPGPVPPMGPGPNPADPAPDPLTDPVDPGEPATMPPSRDPFPDTGDIPDPDPIRAA